MPNLLRSLAFVLLLAHQSIAGGFDDKLELPKQPERSKLEQADVERAAAALRAMLGKAKTAKTAIEFCASFTKLGTQMHDLIDVGSPPGVDPDAFQDKEREIWDVVNLSHPGWCDDPPHADLDDLRGAMVKIRERFVALVALGANVGAPSGEKILTAQLDAVKHWSDDSAMQATFAKSAIILFTNGEYPVSEGSNATKVALLNPHSTVKDATFDHFTSGANEKLAWFTADLHFSVYEEHRLVKHTIRAVELQDGSAGWKVAVAAFANVDKLNANGSSPIKDATDPGPLTKLLVTPDALAGALDTSAVVLGTDPAERGQGAAAKTLLGKWKSLKLTIDTSQKVREVHTATYGYAMANVVLAHGKDSLAMNAFVLALPRSDGSWSVIAASYGATF